MRESCEAVTSLSGVISELWASLVGISVARQEDTRTASRFLPETTATPNSPTNVWETYTLKQNIGRNNRGFYWIVTALETWLKPPLVLKAVTVITFSPVGSCFVK